MAAKFGQLESFNPDTDSVSACIERVHLFFAANDIPDKKAVAVFLSTIGAKTYELLRNLLSPTPLESLKLDELTEVLKRHFEPKPVVIAERFHFHRRSQAPSKSVADYLAELRRLSKNCDFKSFLEQALRDRFVCGLRSEVIQRRLLTDVDLTLGRAFEIAQGMEAADKNTESLKLVQPAVHKLDTKQRSPQSQVCYRCGRSNHSANNCKFRNSTCHKCNKKGHIAPVCRSKKQETAGNSSDSRRKPDRRTKYVAAEEKDESDPLVMKMIREPSAKPYFVTMNVNGRPLKMEIDTGAAVSIISTDTMKHLVPDATLKMTDVRMQTYTGQPMKVQGYLDVAVEYNGQAKDLRLFVVQEPGPPLLGKSWLEHIRLDWASIAKVAVHNLWKPVVEKHAAVFADELGTITPFKASLKLRADARPTFRRPRSVPYATKQAVEDELDRLEKVPFSEWAAPIVVVPKKDGKIRMCGDYKTTINPVMEVDQYPLPKPEDLFATLAGGKKFSTLDLSQAYLQLLLDEESSKLVTVNTHRGLYQYLRLPFGMASAPVLFQKTMDTVLQGIPNVICYIDDILVTGANDDEHLRNLGRVLERLEKHGLRIKEEKCRFMQESVVYLGHQIDATGLHTDPGKVEAIANAPEPTNVAELRSFLGMLNYYRKFAKNLATILHPLNRLLQKSRRWEWNDDCKRAFQMAKESPTSSSVLVHYDSTLPLRLAADASAYGLGAVLSHVMPDGSEHPISFASCTLTAAERNYAQLEKEALALVFGIKKFHQYLFGRKFTLVTDHRPLLAILGPKKMIPPLAAARMQRWALLLSAYSYDLEFRTSEKHANADGLSRLPLHTTSPAGYSREPTVFNISQIESLPITAGDIRQAARKDRTLSKVFNYTKRGWPPTVNSALQPYFTKRAELTIEQGCLLWGIRVVVPKALQQQILQELHQDHPGASRMKSLARSHVWWPGLDKDIESLAKSCQACLAVKQAPPRAPLQPWTWPSKPWQRIHIDFAGPFQNRMYFLVVDSHSKWPEMFEMSQTTTTKTIDVLRHLFAKYGLPQHLVSDNGPQFTSEEFTQFLKNSGVRHTKSPPYHPATNGAVERLVRTFKQSMKAGESSGLSMSHGLENFLLAYQTTPHTTTQVTPCSLFLGREIRTRLDLLQPDIQQHLQRQQEKQKAHYDTHAKERSLTVGQKVMARNYRTGPSWVPATVTQALGSLTFLVCVQSGDIWKRHLHQLKAVGTYNSPSTSYDDFNQSQDTNDIEPETHTTEPRGLSDQEHTETETDEEPATTISPRYPQRNRNPPDRFESYP